MSHGQIKRFLHSGGVAIRRLVMWDSDERADASTEPTITWGQGAPTAAEPNGSVYIREDGTADTTLYVRIAGAWRQVTQAALTAADAAQADVDAAALRIDNRLLGDPDLADGTTDGAIATGAALAYTIAGRVYTKAATDDLWDLSGETDTTAAGGEDPDEYRAYWLYLDDEGAASFVAGTPSEADDAGAIAGLPAPDADLCVAGVYVAGPGTDFDGAAGLAAQGTLITGWPTGLLSGA